MRWLIATAVAMTVLAATVQARALEPLDRDEMAAVSGSGIALALEDIRVTASPTSFVELTGTEPDSTLFSRADLRLYGLSLTGTEATYTWSGNCGQGLMGLGCPLGGNVEHLAAHDNPFVLRAFERQGPDFQGGPSSRGVLELVWPTSHDPFRLAFWGEFRVGADGGSPPSDGMLQFQNILNHVDLSGSRLSFGRHTEPGRGGLGTVVDLHFATDLRLSVNQDTGSPDIFGVVPRFTDREGLHVEHLRGHLPLGQLHYQSLVVEGVPEQDGNIILSLSRIPNEPEVYNHFYGRTLADDPTGGYDPVQTFISDTWGETHGFIRWGDWRGGNVIPGYHPDNDPQAPRADVRAEFPGTFMPDTSSPIKNPPSSTSAGMFLAAREGNTFQPEVRGNFFDQGPGGTPQLLAGEDLASVDAINLGDGRVEGLLIQSLSIRTRGAVQ